jgi:Family of unknown function (DUF6459)
VSAPDPVDSPNPNPRPVARTRRPRYPTIAEATEVRAPATFPAADTGSEPAAGARLARTRAGGTVEFAVAPPCEPLADDEVEGGDLRVDARGAGGMAGAGLGGRYGGVPRGELPPPKQWLDRLLVVVLECLEGWRPVLQLRGHASPLVIGGLVARRRGNVVRPGVVPRVHSIHVTEPTPGIVEACAVVSRVGRIQAIAIRMEVVSARWRCTALHVLE